MGGGEVKVGPDIKDLKKVTAADNEASNGVVHIIDGVMLPPAAPAMTTSQPNIGACAVSTRPFHSCDSSRGWRSRWHVEFPWSLHSLCSNQRWLCSLAGRHG